MSDTENKPDKQRKPLSKIVGASSRLTLTYVVIFIWIALAVFGILIKTDLYALAAYFASGLPAILGYLWSETSRPTTNQIPIVNPNVNPVNPNVNPVNPNPINPIKPFVRPVSPISNIITPISNIITDVVQKYSIYSDDSAVEIKVNKNELTTLMNIGYVNNNGGRYTFQRSSLDQIKSLINDNSQEPNI